MRWACTLMIGLLAILPTNGQSPAPLPWVPMPRTLDEEDSVDSQAAAKLRESIQKLQAERNLLRNTIDQASKDSGPLVLPLALDSAILKIRIQKLLTELEGPKIPMFPPMPVKVPGKITPAKKDPAPKEEVTIKNVADPLALGQVLQGTGKYERALEAYRRIPLTGRTDETLPVKYLMAVCLDRMNRTQEAAAMLEDVLRSGKDQAIQESAVWRLQSIRWRQEMDGKLNIIRKKREALEAAR